MEASCSGLHAPTSVADSTASNRNTFGAPAFSTSPNRNKKCKARCRTARAHLITEKRTVNRPQPLQWHGFSRRRCKRVLSATPPAVELIAQGEVADVEEIEGLRVVMDEQNRPMVEYLIKWKDGAPSTWEPESNLADNLLRDFETMWWTACREGDEAKLKKLLSTSGRVLANVVDENRRSGLHFVAAIGNVPCTKMFCQAGADLNLGDKEGYTPLHMAVGYSHVATVAALLEAGADPEVQDRQSRDVIALVESIRDKMPIAPEYMGRRMALEQVTALLADNLFEEVEPVAVLKARKNENGTRDFLVKWSDGSEDSWVPQWNVANDVVEDFDAGLEYGEAERIVKSVQRGDTREYLVQWKDDYPDSWELEDNLPQHIIAEFEERQRQRLLSTMHTVTDAQNGSSSRSRAPQDKASSGHREPAGQPA